MLRQRIASAVVGLAILALVLWVGGTWGWGVLAATGGVIGVIEFYRISGSSHKPLVLLGCIWTALLVLSPLATTGLGGVGAAVLGAGLVASFIWLLASHDKQLSLPAFVWTLAGVLYVGWLLRYTVALRVLDDGRNWVILTLLTTFATDTAAFFVGRTWGRHKLSPQVSPGKTKEGAVGGLAGGIVASWVLAMLLHLPLSPWKALLLGLLVSVFAQIGDLTESMFKRSAGVKDSGRLMPGHGGILDRIDSILLTGIVVYYYVMILT
ncbi:MAG: phosphatidate cytidylyltransferase [Dehalococcoidia bacterium]|nr:phosphatidate cytidylyltransferase [Dehalococcoidia bacterium]